MMSMVRKAVTAGVIVGACVAFAPAVWAQSAEELSVRMTQMEDQMRQLVGQVEQLSFQVRTLQDQLSKAQHSDAGQIPAPVTTTKRTTVAEMPAAAQGIEQIQDNDSSDQQGQITTIVTENGSEEQVIVQ